MRRHRSFNHSIPVLVCLLSLLLAYLPGCGIGTRFIFTPTHDFQGTPEQVGLAYEDVWFTATDGTRLHGWLVPGTAEKPLFLFFHGNAANITHRIEQIDCLHRLGFSVFIFDYRGFGRSEGIPLREEDLQHDGRGALTFLQERGWSTDRLIYFGSSLGAAVAVQMALEQPPAGIVLEAPFTSLAGIARHMTPIAYGIFGWWSVGDGFDNLQKVSYLRVPLLIIHGDRDAVVPTAMSRQLFARAREPKYLYIVAGGGHSDCFAVGGNTYRQALLRFAATPLHAARPALGQTATEALRNR